MHVGVATWQRSPLLSSAKSDDSAKAESLCQAVRLPGRMYAPILGPGWIALAFKY